MKTRLLICLCALIATVPAWSQSPTVSPEPSAPSAIAAPTGAPTTSVAPVISPSATVSITSDSDEDIDNAIEKKIKKHLNFNFDGDHHHDASDDVPWIAIPIVFIVFLAIFGTPVMIVALIMYFSFSKSRAMHRTVRMMVEKGQPVPEALLNPPPVIRQRSDLRRGVVLLMVGTGLMIFFGACNDWEGGAWSLGIIPFLIGAGYLLVWRLDFRRGESLPPSPPPPPTETSPKV
jgi:Domain of unknown function (DUF6249)